MKKAFILLFLLTTLLRSVWAAETSCQIVVAGSGAAGLAAALFAGEAGADVILLEATHQLGGNTTSGGVNFPGIFHAWGKQIIDGPVWKLIEECVELDGGKMPDFSIVPDRHWKHQVRINPALFVLLAEEALQKRNVKIRYYETPTALEPTPDGWIVRTAAMGENRVIRCRQIIDCTGNAALCAMAGAERMREEETQPGTFNYFLTLDNEIKPTREQLAEWRKRAEEAVRKGELLPEDIRGNVWDAFSAERSSSFNYVFNADNSTAESRTDTNLRGRAAALRVLRFARSLPGLENARLAFFPPEVGVRETWRVRGEIVISCADYTSGKVWDDSLAFAYYPVDLHVNASGVAPAQLTEGVLPTIPLRALLPAGVENMLAAGRCLSSDRLANSGLRVQGASMAGGQAAAAAAVIAVREGTSPRKASLQAMKTLLRELGAIVPE